MTRRPLLVLVTVTTALMALPVCAEEDDERSEKSAKPRVARTSVAWKQYEAECGSCHLAFPPDALPARSWVALLGGLADHFGQNAELDAPRRAAVERFLRANSGREVAGPTPLRLTTLPSWVREHREVSASVFARKAVLSAANCGACHPGAAQGDFEEHQVRVPAADAAIAPTLKAKAAPRP